MPKNPPTRVSPEQSSLILNAQQLAEYAAVDPALPALVIATRNAELKRRFAYAVIGLLSGVLVVFGILGLFTYLVMQGHTTAAAALLSAGVLGLAGGFVRSRL